jgi:ligand-binding sensor domain-containing protein
LELEAKTANFILSDDQQSGLKFKKIFIDSSNELYAASDKGLHQGNLESRKFEFFDIDDGLADNNLSLIKVDSKGNVFVGSENGLSVSIKE